jgi:rhomboid family GlyGly-CTERM serine protease
MITKSLKPLILGVLLLSILIIVAQFFRDDFVFYRSQIEVGHWWLLVSGNFVHSNYPHLFMNLAGLWILGFLFIDSLSLKTFIISTLLLGIFVGLGLYYFNPELQKYYGLSGILYGLFLVGAITAILNQDRFTGIITAITIIAKIAWDMVYGGSNSSAELIGVPVAVHAHLYGVVGAIFVGIGLYLVHLKRI